VGRAYHNIIVSIQVVLADCRVCRSCSKWWIKMVVVALQLVYSRSVSWKIVKDIADAVLYLVLVKLFM